MFLNACFAQPKFLIADAFLGFNERAAFLASIAAAALGPLVAIALKPALKTFSKPFPAAAVGGTTNSTAMSANL